MAEPPEFRRKYEVRGGACDVVFVQVLYRPLCRAREDGVQSIQLCDVTESWQSLPVTKQPG